ncbi:MAG: type II secretion system protein GspD [Candidatus Sumerlaeota bacterium]
MVNPIRHLSLIFFCLTAFGTFAAAQTPVTEPAIALPLPAMEKKVESPEDLAPSVADTPLQTTAPLTSGVVSTTGTLPNGTLATTATTATQAAQAPAVPAIDLDNMQVAIEALVVEVNENQRRQLGVEILHNRNLTNADAFEYEGLRSRFLPGVDQLNIPDMGLTNEPAGFGLRLEDTGGYGSISMQIRALAESTGAEIRTHPIVIALHNTKAEIATVEEVPYQDVKFKNGKGEIEIKFEKVGIKLVVTPTIQEPLEKGIVELNLHNIEVSQVSRFITVRDVNRPVFVTSNAETNVALRNGETLVIGGLQSRREVLSESRTPVIGNIPLIGRLFSQESRQIRDTQIMFFITPYILVPGVNPILPYDFENRAEVLPEIRDLVPEVDPEALAEDVLGVSPAAGEPGDMGEETPTP